MRSRAKLFHLGKRVSGGGLGSGKVEALRSGTIRLTRWTLRLQQFNFQVHHRKGCLNLGPDVLSQACEFLEGEDAHCLAITTPKCSSDLPHTLDEISQAQGSDSTISHLKLESKNRKVQDQQRSTRGCYFAGYLYGIMETNSNWLFLKHLYLDFYTTSIKICWEDIWAD